MKLKDNIATVKISRLICMNKDCIYFKAIKRLPSFGHCLYSDGFIFITENHECDNFKSVK